MAVTAYNYEFGFDWNSTANPAGSPFPLTLEGILRASQKFSSPPNPALTLQKQDVFCIDVCNKTSGANSADYSINEATITFKAKDNSQTVASPFNQTGSLPLIQPSTPIYLTQFTVGSLGVASGSTENNPVYGGQSFPAWTPVFQLLQTNTAGSFSFSVTLIVQGPGGTKAFFCPDPEMIVEGPIGSY